MHKLMELNYIEWHRMDEHNDYISDLMYTYLTSIDLLIAFLMVFIIDYTYKTNRY